MVGEQNGTLIAQCLADNSPFLVAERHSRPAREEGTVFIQVGRVHMADHERLLEHAESRAPERMGMYDAFHFGARP